MDGTGIDDKKFICPDQPFPAVSKAYLQIPLQNIDHLKIVMPVRRAAVTAIINTVKKANADVSICRNPFKITLHVPSLFF